jgi:hypothetical protein
MAKGWESKSIEAQVEDSQSQDPKFREQGTRKGQFTPAQMETHRRREVLLLSRARVERDLQASQSSRYREQLIRALADLDAQLSEINNAG